MVDNADVIGISDLYWAIDPVLLFAVKNQKIDQTLIDISVIDKTSLNQDEITAFYNYVVNAASSGSVFAMCMCFDFALIGWGREKSQETAYEWAKRAASKEFAPGFFLVGRCYEDGIGVVCDFDKAKNNYLISIDGGFGYAASYLAFLFYSGKFGQPDIIEALKYIEIGAFLNEPTAPLIAAGWYEAGELVKKDMELAAKWYLRAADLGNFFAWGRLNQAYKWGELGLTKNEQLASKYEKLFNKCYSLITEKRHLSLPCSSAISRNSPLTPNSTTEL